MQSMDALLETLQKNEEITRKFHVIETKILATLDFKGLFETLLGEIRDIFQVPYVWLTIIESGDNPEFLQFLEHSDALETHLNIVSSDTFFRLVPGSTRPLLVNSNLKPFFHLLPPNRKFLFKSMAISPITFEGRIIGSLNQADFSPDRFTPDIDTSLLEQLAIKVSLCLSNVTAHEKLKFLAYRDPLTGILNRRVMESILEREFKRARRYNSPLSLAFLDIDHFKKINDSHGHDGGDKTLIFVARELEHMVRNSDVVARFAGDEFVIILPETPSAKADTLMRRMKAHFLESPLKIMNVPVFVSISFGISSNENATNDTPEAILKDADNRLYQMKSKRNQHK